MNDKTVVVKVEAYDAEWVAPPGVSSEEATKEKGYDHPGSFIELPNGFQIPIQFGLNPTQARNGFLAVEVIQGLIDHLGVYQSRGHEMATRETALAITKLEEAMLWLHKRSIDRQTRAVRYTDKA